MVLTDLLLYSLYMFLGLMIFFPILMTIWAVVKGTALEVPAKIIFGLPYWIVDWVFNWTVMTVVFWPDKPEYLKEVTTKRFKRYIKTEKGRRLKFAIFCCRWLNRWDKGHCE